jgi:Fic-DOC domain mobile mystery protein B
MMVPASEGNTPLSPEELADLIPNLATKEELNEWERQNILRARAWALKDRTPPIEMIADVYLRKLHARMFDQTWRWAGQYRRTEKNIGVPVYEMRDRLAVQLGDARYWIEHATYPPHELVVRFHHRLVVIHPFPNGNGRHARIFADLLVIKLGQPALTWGSAELLQPGTARQRYLEAMRRADHDELQPLLDFARS